MKLDFHEEGCESKIKLKPYATIPTGTDISLWIEKHCYFQNIIIINTAGALRRPLTYDNHPSNPIESTFCSPSRKAQNDSRRTRATSDELTWTNIERQINNKTERQKDSKTKRQKIRKTERQKDRKTVRQGRPTIPHLLIPSEKSQ